MKTTSTWSRESPPSKYKKPRSRKRKGANCNYGHSDQYSGFIELSEEPLNGPHIQKLSGNSHRVRGMKVRNSLRWYKMVNCNPVTGYNFPFFDTLGKYTGQTLAVWSGDPRQIVASAISTVSSRLLRYCFKHNSSNIVNKRTQVILRAAYYYVVTKNNWFWDRVLFFSRNLEKSQDILRKFVTQHIHKLGDNKRFVYGHVCLQTQWLLFRAERPRGKPTKYISKRTEILARDSPPASLFDNGIHLGQIAKAICTL